MFCLLIPSFIVWIHNIRHSSEFPQDPYLITTILVMSTCYIFWKDDLLPSSRSGYKFLSYILYILAVLTAMFTLIKVYYIIYSFTVALCIMAFLQMITKHLNKTKCD